MPYAPTPGAGLLDAPAPKVCTSVVSAACVETVLRSSSRPRNDFDAYAVPRVLDPATLLSATRRVKRPRSATRRTLDELAALPTGQRVGAWLLIVSLAAFAVWGALATFGALTWPLGRAGLDVIVLVASLGLLAIVSPTRNGGQA